MEIEELLSYYVADHEVYNSSCRDSSKYKGVLGFWGFGVLGLIM